MNDKVSSPAARPPAAKRTLVRRVLRKLGAASRTGADAKAASRENLIDLIASVRPTPTGPERVQLLAYGDALLNDHGDVRGALSAYLKAAECGPAAKWEFGERLLNGINSGRIRDGDLPEVVARLAGHREPTIVPDLWRGLAAVTLARLDRRSADQILKSILPFAELDLLHEASEKARAIGANWATAVLLQTLSDLASEGRYSPGFGLYLKLGHAHLSEGNVREAVAAYCKAQSLDRDSKFHLGAYLLEQFPKLELSEEQLVQLIGDMDDADLLAPDIRPVLLVGLLAFPRTHGNLAIADRLVRGMSRKHLIDAADAALAKADHTIALFCYEEGIKKDPQDILTRLQIGITHFLANEHQQAEAHFSTLMTLQAAERERWGVEKLPVRVMHWTWLQAFGHITCLDTYIKAMKLGWLPDYQSILGFDRTNPPAGWRLLSYFSKHLDIVGAAGEPGPAIDQMIFGPNDTALSPNQKDLRRTSLMNFFWALPNNKGRMRYFGNIGSDVQRAWKAEGRGPIISVEDEERKCFRTVMEQSFGLPQDAWYVLLHVRESTFKPGWESHHQYTRNASIDDYDEAIDWIISQGGWVIRAGDPSMRRLKPRKKVIDYATSPMRSPELDILLCAESRFFLGTNSGFSLTPPLFGKRCVLTNWSPLANPNWYPDDIFIPKLVRERKTGRFLTIEEMYKSKAGWSQFVRDFKTTWEKLDNSPEEIRQVVQEMVEELENGVRRTPEALQAEAIYHEIVERNGGYIGSRLSDGFLARHSWLLGDAAPRASGAGRAAAQASVGSGRDVASP